MRHTDHEILLRHMTKVTSTRMEPNVSVRPSNFVSEEAIEIQVEMLTAEVTVTPLFMT